MSKKYNVTPLSAEEKRWVRDLERVLLRTPERLELYTIGDRDLTVFTNEFGTDGKDSIVDCAPGNDGRSLAHVKSACPIHGLCG